MRCNGAFRFDALVAFAERAGADELWTGHYARIVERDGMRLVAKALDERKDQSYMLAAVDPSLLERVRFPLGDQTKDDTRAQAVALGLAAAGRAESQEACFLGGDDYRAFLGRQGSACDDRRDRGPGRGDDRRARRLLGVHAGPAPRRSRRNRSAALRSPNGRRDEHRDRGKSRAARGDVRRHAGPPVSLGDAEAR